MTAKGMVKYSGYTEPEAISFIREANGNLTLAAQMMGISRTSLVRYLKDWPEAAQVLAETREQTKDKIEHKLFEKALDGDLTAIIFYLKTQGRDRGYQENSRVESVSVRMDVSKLTEDQLRRIAAGESVASVVSGGGDGDEPRTI
jgi:hypothetical protein